MLFKTLRNVLFDYRTAVAPRIQPGDRWGRVALVKVDGIGDFVLATTFLNAFRACRPGADVTLVCRSPVSALAAWQFPGWRVESVPAKVKPLREILRSRPTRRTLRQLPKFDFLIDLRSYRDAADAAISSWIPAQFKVALQNGFPEHFQWAALPDEDRVFDCYITRPTRNATMCDDIACHRRLAESLFGEGSQALLPAIRVSAEERDLLRKKLGLSAEKPHLLICPGTSIPQKEYPPGALAEVLRRTAIPKEYRIVIAGSPGDARTIGPLKAALGGQFDVLDLAGRLTMVENAILIASMTAVIAMDSCHAHIAGATDTPALVLLTGEQRGFFGPWNASDTFRWVFSSANQTTDSQPFRYSDYLTTDTLPIARVVEELSALLRTVGSART